MQQNFIQQNYYAGGNNGMVNPYAAGGVGYQPTPPSFKYNGIMPPPIPPQTGYYTSLGQYATAQLNNNPQPYYYNNGYGYNYQQSYDQVKAKTFDEAYANGQMPLSQYTYYNNGGFHNYRGNNYQYGRSDDWFANAANYSMMQQERQRQYLEEQRVQMECWKILFRVHERYQGIYNSETEQTRFEQKVLFDQAMQAYLYQVQQEEMQQGHLEDIMNKATKSTDKGYVSPVKMALITNWNNYYHLRNDNYPKEYGVDEFFNQGIMTNQIIDHMVDDANRKERELFSQYNKQEFRQAMHQMYPHYDPLSGRTIESGRLSLDDMEVQLPPQISEDEYFKRKQSFINSIMNNHSFSP